MLDTFIELIGGGDYPRTIYNDSQKENGISHYAKDAGMSMIALGTHGRSGLSRFFDDSVSEGLVNHSFLPVLTLNVGKKEKKKPGMPVTPVGPKISY